MWRTKRRFCTGSVSRLRPRRLEVRGVGQLGEDVGVGVHRVGEGLQKTGDSREEKHP